jgi:hypothetical protein
MCTSLCGHVFISCVAMLTGTLDCMVNIYSLNGNCQIVFQSGRKFYPYANEHSSCFLSLPWCCHDFLLFAILMEEECVSLWWMDFDGCWVCLMWWMNFGGCLVCLNIMNRFWWWLSVPHCDRCWVLSEMDFEKCWVCLIVMNGFW